MTLILVLLLIIVIASIVIPNLISSLTSLISNISSFLINIFDNIDEIFIYFGIDFRMEDIGSVKELINMPWQEMVSQALNILSKSAGGIMANATDFLSKFGIAFTGFIFSLYLLSNKETFLRQLRKAIGALFGYRITKIIFMYAHKTNEVFSNFISGQLTEAAILWILYYTTMRLFGFPYRFIFLCTIFWANYSYVHWSNFNSIKRCIISSLVYDIFSDLITIGG